MKFIHLADLHLGKRYCESSLIDDQRHILNRILNIADDNKPDALIIAGDVYDKSVPSAEAVTLFDGFLCALADRRIRTFVISGNHDSPERIAFGGRLMGGSGVHLAPVYGGKVVPVVLNDEFGEVNVYMLPFVRPANVRQFCEGEIQSYTDALKAVIDDMNVDVTKRNVLVAHQFVTGSARSGSEEFSVGDAGNVDSAVFAPFDYVALGHIHGAQNVGSERIRYCGTPLKYSLSEKDDVKSVTVVELGKKGELKISEIPLVPLHDVKEITGLYGDITQRSYYFGTSLTEDYVHIVLSDEEEIPDALGKLRLIYKNVMSVRYDNTRTRCDSVIISSEERKSKSPKELFEELFVLQNNKPMTEGQEKLIDSLIAKAWGEEL